MRRRRRSAPCPSTWAEALPRAHTQIRRRLLRPHAAERNLKRAEREAVVGLAAPCVEVSGAGGAGRGHCCARSGCSGTDAATRGRLVMPTQRTRSPRRAEGPGPLTRAGEGERDGPPADWGGRHQSPVAAAQHPHSRPVGADGVDPVARDGQPQARAPAGARGGGRPRW